jgi:hypothetical protein
MRACAAPDPSDPVHTICGFKYSGNCGVCTAPFTQPHTCRTFDPDDGSYGDCLALEENSAPSVTFFREVNTTFVKP